MSTNDYVVDFFAVGEKGYKIGTKRFHSYTTCVEALRKAFAYEMPDVDELHVSVVFTTKYRGECTLNFTEDDYETQITAMNKLINSNVVTLDELLA